MMPSQRQRKDLLGSDPFAGVVDETDGDERRGRSVARQSPAAPSAPPLASSDDAAVPVPVPVPVAIPYSPPNAGSTIPPDAAVVHDASVVFGAGDVGGIGSEFEVLPGLRVALGGRHSVYWTPVVGGGFRGGGGGGERSGGRAFEVTVRAETFSVGPPDLFLCGTGLGLRAIVRWGEDDAGGGGGNGRAAFRADATATDASLSVTTVSLGPMVGSEDVAEFLARFGPRARTTGPRRSRRSAGVAVAADGRGKEVEAVGTEGRGVGGADAFPAAMPQKDSQGGDAYFSDADVGLPRIRASAFECRIPGCGGRAATSVAFPECEGAEGCTLRALIGYYVRTLLEKIKEEDKLRDGGGGGGGKDDDNAVTLGAAATDVTSVYGSAVGMAAGSVLFGPVGLIAGSYYGGKAGRAHSSALVGAAAGALLLGPAGLVAGAVVGSRRDVKRGEEEDERKKREEAASAAAPKRVGSPEVRAESPPSDGEDNVVDGAARAAGRYVSSNKNELAGTAGVWAGAAAGAAVLGPVGIIPGALVGSVSGRKIVQDCGNESSSAARGGVVDEGGVDRSGGVAVGGGSGRKPYRFGDFTRGVVARGKESRGASKSEEYKFGDFTRGLFK